MAEENIILTREGYNKLEKELDFLKNEKRREVAKRIKHAREFGDISENAEYDEAKNEQAFVEGRIQEIEHLLRNAEIAEESEDDVVAVGKTVTLFDKENEEEITYHIVGSAESDPLDFKISNQSPLGKAIIGKRVGDDIEFEAPIGKVEYKIVSMKK